MHESTAANKEGHEKEAHLLGHKLGSEIKSAMQLV